LKQKLLANFLTSIFKILYRNEPFTEKSRCIQLE